MDKAHASDAVALGSNHARASIYFLNKFHFKVAHSSFFFPSGETLKAKFLRFLLYYTIIVTYDENFIFHSFPSNKGYHSNNTSILFFLNKADFLEIESKTLNQFFHILQFDRLATCRRNFIKICKTVLE